jgi:3-deoxy-D-manno-octulosonic-acid transferase
MRIIYKFGIQVYFLLVILAAPFHIKARRWLKGRRGIWRRIKKSLPEDKKGPTYWFHCSSLGEFEQGRPIMEAIREKDPDCFIILTFFSPSGYELRKNFRIANVVTYMPLDTRYNAWRFMNLVKPDAAYFIKYEFWYYFLRTLFKKKVPTYLVSAKFRRDQAFFKWYGLWYRKFLHFFTHFYVQDETSRKLLGLLGFKNVVVAGDTRFDRVYQIAQQSRDYSEINDFRGNKTVIVAGSTWEKDEDLLLDFINQSDESVKFILAPHEISSRKIYRLMEHIDLPVVRFSDEDKGGYSRAKVLLIDTIGHLSSIYKYGHIAYIGGGFGKGIHNTLEAATYRLPVVFGPNYQKFLEAREMLEQGAAFSIESYHELKNAFSNLLDNSTYLNECSHKAKEYVHSRLGATQKIVDDSLISFG